MKLTIFGTLFFTVFLSSMPAFAGGIICKSCPGESEHCIPRPGCSRVASESILDKIMKMYDSEYGLYPTISKNTCKDKIVGSNYEMSENEKEACGRCI